MVEPLIQALEDNSPDVRGNAAQALGKIGDERAVGPLVMIMNDPNENFPPRENEILALGEIGEPAVEPFIQILDSNVAGLAAMAAYSLRVIGEFAVEPLIQAMEDEKPQIRARAAEALGGIKDKRAIEPLTRALHDKYGMVFETEKNRNSSYDAACSGDERYFADAGEMMKL